MGFALGSGFAPRGHSPKKKEALTARHSLASHQAAKPRRECDERRYETSDRG